MLLSLRILAAMVAIHPILSAAQDLSPQQPTPQEMAKATGVPATRIGEIVRGRRAITAETALRLAAFFDNSPQFWMNLQTEYDLRLARQSLKGRLAKKVKPLAATIRHPVLK